MDGEVGKIDIHRMFKELSAILSEMYGVEVKITARPKEEKK